MRLARALLFVSAGFSLVVGVVSRADDIYTVTVKKQEAKKSTRWTLAEWLATKDRMKAMDQWLAMNSPSPYEFYLRGDFEMMDRGGQDRKTFGGRFAAYAHIAGLEAIYDRMVKRWYALVHLRIFGYHAQSTNITFLGGVRFQDDPAMHTGAVAGVSGSLYLIKFVGVMSNFYYHFKSTPNDTGFERGGYRVEVDGFIDFNFFRVFAGYAYESETASNAAGETSSSLSGAHVGGTLFF